MTTKFETAVREISGEWPSPPKSWSFSSLTEVEACPRRWMLSRARYPDIWDGYGYPSVPGPAAVLGSVVHNSVEVVLLALRQAGAPSVFDELAVAVLTSLGGITAIIDKSIEKALDESRGNPRAEPRLDQTLKYLSVRTPQIRERVQSLVARTVLVPRHLESDVPVGSHQTAPTARKPLIDGSYTELDLRAANPNIAGRVDLLTLIDGDCTITDFKTGEPKEAHCDQVRMYGLLWFLDAELNPLAKPAKRLELLYRDGVEEVDAPDTKELGELEGITRERVQAAEIAIASEDPEARPSRENCQFCGVRHMCEAFWADADLSSFEPLEPGEAGFADCEIEIGGQLGPRSWEVLESVPAGVKVLVSSDALQQFEPGTRVRLLGARVVSDPEAEALTASVAYASDAFILREDSQ